jgi:hypothetical protein
MSSSYCLRGRANILLEHKEELIQCSKDVEDLNQIMDRFYVDTRLD